MATLAPKTAAATPSVVLVTVTASPTATRLVMTPTLAVTKLIAFMASPVEKANPDIFTMAPDGSRVTNLTRHPAEDRLPAWSPDGSQLAFLSTRDDRLGLYVMNADGTNVRQVVHGMQLPLYRPSWSADGKAIAFTSKSESNKEAILEVNLDSLEIKALIKENDSNNNSLAWSPDGSAIAFVSDRSAGVPQIFVLNLFTKKLQQVTMGVNLK